MSVVNSFPVIAGFGTIYQSIVVVGCLFFCQLCGLSFTVKYFAIAQTNAISLNIFVIGLPKIVNVFCIAGFGTI